MKAWRSINAILNQLLAGAVALLMAVLVLDVVWQVATRYLLGDPSPWTEELATFLLIWVSLLGACVALQRGAHLGIDYFVEKFSPAAQRVARVFATLSVGAFAVSVLGCGGIVLVVRILRLDQITPALGVRMGYVYLALPISGFFMTLTCIDSLVRGRAAGERDASSAPRLEMDSE